MNRLPGGRGILAPAGWQALPRARDGPRAGPDSRSYRLIPACRGIFQYGTCGPIPRTACPPAWAGRWSCCYRPGHIHPALQPAFQPAFLRRPFAGDRDGRTLIFRSPLALALVSLAHDASPHASASHISSHHLRTAFRGLEVSAWAQRLCRKKSGALFIDVAVRTAPADALALPWRMAVQ